MSPRGRPRWAIRTICTRCRSLTAAVVRKTSSRRATAAGGKLTRIIDGLHPGVVPRRDRLFTTTRIVNKFVGSRSFLEWSVAPATNGGLMLVGEHGTAKSYLSEL